MKSAFKTHATLFTLVCLSATLIGCDWNFPLTSPGRARVDTNLIGNWLITNVSKEIDEERESVGKSILFFGKAIAASEENRSKYNLPAGAMLLWSNGATTGGPPEFQSSGGFACWPTQVAKTKILNLIALDQLKENKTENEDYLFWKYEINGDRLTLYGLTESSKKKIAVSLGKSYSSADLYQEISSKSLWTPLMTARRIQ